MRSAVLLAICSGMAAAWPGMKRADVSANSDSHIGPDCTVGVSASLVTEQLAGRMPRMLCCAAPVQAHGFWPESGPCPNMAQPSPPPSTGVPPHPIDHVWPNQVAAASLRLAVQSICSLSSLKLRSTLLIGTFTLCLMTRMRHHTPLSQAAHSM